MSRKYKFRDQSAIYFVSFATVFWIDVFTRKVYKDILVESINYCVENKGLLIYGWVIMSNHVHLIIGTCDKKLQDIMRDLKKFSSKAIIEAIKENPKESRKEWILTMFEEAGSKNSNNSRYQFWQQHNQPIVLNNADIFEQKLNYIHENPVKSGFVNETVDYPYSSANDYSGEKGMVIMDIEYE
ncbi:MAG: transposase [Bacteroidales bacterium]|nr:transposase [Bacteroidales bacterium]